jgi:hypothetical protein
MNGRALVAAGVVPLLLVAAIATRAPAAQAQWSTESCRWDLQTPWPAGFPLSEGGVMNGQGCAMWHQTLYLWQVWASTLLNQTSYWIWTYVRGEDSCGGFSFTPRMSSSGSATNASSGSSGPYVQGQFTECGPNIWHYYRAVTQHQRQLYSSSPAEGYIAAANW